ncbi:MAG: hypothetical protein WDW38_004747 [Sanguina aurantia]
MLQRTTATTMPSTTPSVVTTSAAVRWGTPPQSANASATYLPALGGDGTNSPLEAEHSNGNLSSIAAGPSGSGPSSSMLLPSFARQPPLLPFQSLRGCRPPSILCISSSLHRHTGAAFQASAHNSSDSNVQASLDPSHPQPRRSIDPLQGDSGGSSEGSSTSLHSSSRKPPAGPRRVASGTRVPRPATRLSCRASRRDSAVSTRPGVRAGAGSGLLDPPVRTAPLPAALPRTAAACAASHRPPEPASHPV